MNSILAKGKQPLTKYLQSNAVRQANLVHLHKTTTNLTTINFFTTNAMTATTHPATSSPDSPDDYCRRVQSALEHFYQQNSHIGESHGLSHAMAVHRHASKAIESHRRASNTSNTDEDTLSDTTAMEIRVAAMLHDVDDRKYFPPTSIGNGDGSDSDNGNGNGNDSSYNLPNALRISHSAGIPHQSISRIVQMISWVSTTENGNSVPPEIAQPTSDTSEYRHYRHYHLIPRWADRLEAVGKIGVVRCYQYNRETGAPLSKVEDLYDSPRPLCEEEVWRLATPDRFERYLNGERDGKKMNVKKGKKIKDKNGEKSSMISHYYDKLLHVARPPPEIVKNEYLEKMGRESSKELVEVCLRFGRTGLVDEEYIRSLESQLSMNKPA